jgi:hypothetical protein
MKGGEEAVRETAIDSSQISRRLYPMPSQPTHALWQATNPRFKTPLPLFHGFVLFHGHFSPSWRVVRGAWLGVES